MLEDPTYGSSIAFYDEASEKCVRSEDSSIDFGNGVEVELPKGVVPADTAITFKAQPAFASKDVFILPPGIEAASPTYLLSSSMDSLNGEVTLTIEHFVDLQTEDDSKKLVFLVADSKPNKDSVYRFKVVDSGHPSFKLGEKVGTICTNHFSFWKIGKRNVEAVEKGTVCCILHAHH